MADKLIEGKYSVKSIYETAEKVVTKKTTGSSVLDIDAERRIPKFRTSGRYSNRMDDFNSRVQETFFSHFIFILFYFILGCVSHS